MGITAHVGLTGAMGAGKSTLLGMLAERGAVAFSADEAVHRAYRRRKILEALAVRYGRGILGRDGEVDRRRLAAKVAGEGEELTCWRAWCILWFLRNSRKSCGGR